MTSFFDKLKKGMDIKNTPNLQENLEQDLSEEPTPENEKPPVEKPSVTMVSTSVSDKRTFKKKIKKEPKMKKIKVEKESDKEKVEAGEKKKWFEPEGELTVDVYQTDEEIVIQSAVAGIKPEDLDISIENDLVLIKGNRAKPSENKKRSYFYQECYWGQFSREIILPEEVDPSRIKATMKQGILTIRIPKIERKKKKRVMVRE